MDIETPEAHPESAPKPPSPRPSTKPMASHEEVSITGAAYKPPAPSHVLSKHVKEDEAAPSTEEKTPSDPSNLDKLTADELHSGYLSRLFTSRDMEASLVAKMKAKYEVLYLPCLIIYILM